MDENRTLKTVTLEELKQQMRVDFEDEDQIIYLYGVAAENAVVAGTARTMNELMRIGYLEQTGNSLSKDDVLPDGNWFPTQLKLAVLMLAAHCYRNREPVAAVAQNAVPYTFDVFCKPYRKLTEREV